MQNSHGFSFCLAAGELLSRTGVLPFPGPVIGLLILFANLMVLGKVPEKLGTLADTVLGFLGNPSYGGNRGEMGWKQIGFEHDMAYDPPFGYYDALVSGGRK